MSYIMRALGWVLRMMYAITDNYGLAIILFTIVIKLILTPLTVKQQRSMLKTQKIQPLLMEIQKKYANDQDKMSRETMKIYQKYQINPMSGCLPMVIQLPILFALYYVVRQPILYIMGVASSDVWRIVSAVDEWGASNPDTLKEFLAALNIESLNIFPDNAFKNFGMYEIRFARLLFEHPAIMDSHFITETGKAYKLIDFNLLGIDLSQTPDLGGFLGLIMGRTPEGGFTWNTIGLWLIPLLAGGSSYLTSFISQKLQPPPPPQVDENGVEKPNTMKIMTIIMPLFSIWIAFTLPAAIGFYWIMSGLLQLVQQVTLTFAVHVNISDEEIKEEIENATKNRKKRKK